jgi:hypothetical protein
MAGANKPELGQFAEWITDRSMRDWSPFLRLSDVHVDDASSLLALGGAAAAALLLDPDAEDFGRSEAGDSVLNTALRVLSGRRPAEHVVHALAAASAAQAILNGPERVQLASMLPALAQVPAEDHAEVLRLADGAAPGGTLGARLSEIGLAEGGKATRIGRAFASALAVVLQLVPELEALRQRTTT